MIFMIVGLHPAGANNVGAGERAYSRQDYVRAARLLLPEAQAGRPIARTYLGHLYENGWGVPQNYLEAAKWLTLAAQQGEPTAQFLLGRLYDNGSGVKQDFVEAEFWLDLAAASAQPRQRDYWMNMRDAVAGKLTRDELDKARQRALDWRNARAR
jgi:TPR repeat protein